MSPTGSKLVIVARVFGYDLYEDVEAGYLVLDLESEFVVVNSLKEAEDTVKIRMAVERQYDPDLA